MLRVYTSLAIVAFVVGGYFFFTNNQKKVVDTYSPAVSETTSTGQESDSTSLPQQPLTTMRATFETNKGTIEIELFSTDAPNTVANFVKLAESGFYNSTRFHRVIKGFMIQGGDPLSKEVTMKNQWGTGGPGYQFADEIHSNNRNMTLTIAMANAGADTNGSQFFINTVDNDFLDAKHTVFGKVVSGTEVVGVIEHVPTEGPDRPIDDVIIQKVTIIR